MTSTTKLAVLTAVLLWASAYVGIRAALLSGFSPEGLALLRYLIASLCLGVMYYRLPHRQPVSFKDILQFLFVGIIGIGVYNVALNHGEVSVSSGMASFIISQAPLLAALFAIVFLNEKLNRYNTLGFIVSVLGVTIIALGEMGGFNWDIGFFYIIIATLASGIYSVLQKLLLKRYHVIEAITYVIWGATLFLCLYASQLKNDLSHVTLSTVFIVIYLGVFPAALAYLAWGYALREMPTAKAVSFLYFMPFIATLLGWVSLGEVPALLSLFGGVIAIIGVWLVNHSYRFKNA